MLRANELEENSYSVIWRYLARERAGENGRAELEANAARVKSKDWPYPVFELYLERRSPSDVLSVASKPDERCEAQFYIGEWHLLHGNRAAAATALQAAAHHLFEGVWRVRRRIGGTKAAEPLMLTACRHHSLFAMAIGQCHLMAIRATLRGRAF